jgi:hypothetical protein
MIDHALGDDPSLKTANGTFTTQGIFEMVVKLLEYMVKREVERRQRCEDIRLEVRFDSPVSQARYNPAAY